MNASRGRSSVNPAKHARVELLKKTVLSRPMAALVGLRGVPASALQRMRQELLARNHPIVVAPNSAIRHAIEEAAAERPSLKPLLEHVADQTALLVAEGNPFSLAQELDRTRSPTPARGGEIAPHDIVVPAQTTSFKPGPIVGELQHAGFPAAIEKGKVVLKRDVTIVRAGQPIPREVAGMLTRLEIFPLEVGLSLRALVDRDTFYAPSVLKVDLAELRGQLVSAHRRAFQLALEIGYVTPATVEPLFQRGFRRALAVALAAEYPTKQTIPALVAKAVRQARAIESRAGTPPKS
jgi:large subunit ribosomal protein L10